MLESLMSKNILVEVLGIIILGMSNMPLQLYLCSYTINHDCFYLKMHLLQGSLFFRKHEICNIQILCTFNTRIIPFTEYVQFRSHQ